MNVWNVLAGAGDDEPASLRARKKLPVQEGTTGEKSQ